MTFIYFFYNSLYCAVASANKLNLNLFVLEDCTNAGVKRRSSKHGCHWVGQVCDLPKYGSKILLCTKKKRNLNDGSICMNVSVQCLDVSPWPTGVPWQSYDWRFALQHRALLSRNRWRCRQSDLQGSPPHSTPEWCPPESSLCGYSVSLEFLLVHCVILVSFYKAF